MPVCTWCGKKYDPSEEEEYVYDTWNMLHYDYRTMRINLCGSCANEAVEQQADGVFVNTCERCGREFDPMTENMEFANYVDGISLTDTWDSQVLCAACARDNL